MHFRGEDGLPSLRALQKLLTRDRKSDTDPNKDVLRLRADFLSAKVVPKRLFFRARRAVLLCCI